ncbi:MAG: hypothetical protein KF833_09195 [Verrucomicrobiae bacterium]|nr:hypothetical protein [Verrucomicrobiae bacterium]
MTHGAPLAEGERCSEGQLVRSFASPNPQGQTRSLQCLGQRLEDRRNQRRQPGSLGISLLKIENENNNTLKTKGYHLDHNLNTARSTGSGPHLLEPWPLVHAALGWLDEPYRLLRARLSAGRSFEHVRALTLYIHFPGWSELLDFMMRGLELGPYSKKA